MFLVWLTLHDLRISFQLLAFPSLLPCYHRRIDHVCCIGPPLFEVPDKIKSTIFPWLRSSRSSDYCNGRSLGFIQGGGSPSAWCQRGRPHSPLLREERYLDCLHIPSTSDLEDWNETRIFPVLWYFSVSQICRARFYSLEASSTLPCFRISADMPHLQAGALPFFVALIAFNSSSNSCFSSRHAMFGLCATVSKAQRSATLKLFKVVCKSTKNSSFHCRTVSPSKALSRFLGNGPPTPPLS